MTDEARLMLLPLYVDADLIDCRCQYRPFGKGHTRSCLRERAKWQREKELAQALRPEDVRWLADNGWDGRFA